MSRQYRENPFPQWYDMFDCVPDTNFCSNTGRLTSPKFPDLAMLLSEALEPLTLAEHDPYHWHADAWLAERGEPLRVLFAGCGTGQNILQRALAMPQAELTGVDFSTSSLAFATRKMEEHGIRNVRLIPADILRLDQLGPEETFDIVQSTGVLHHMRDWKEAFGIAVRRLRTGGLFLLSLYSRTARAACSYYLNRGEIASRGLNASSASDIRNFRREVIKEYNYNIIRTADFQTMSQTRDLLFHAHEDATSWAEMADVFKELGLSVLGVGDKGRGELRSKEQYRRRFPLDINMTDLRLWHEIEQTPGNERMFSGMLTVWLRKT